MMAHGFKVDLLVDLVCDGLAIMRSERMRVGGRMIVVSREGGAASALGTRFEGRAQMTHSPRTPYIVPVERTESSIRDDQGKGSYRDE
jgi:hypothetical protein